MSTDTPKTLVQRLIRVPCHKRGAHWQMAERHVRMALFLERRGLADACEERMRLARHHAEAVFNV